MPTPRLAPTRTRHACLAAGLLLAAAGLAGCAAGPQPLAKTEAIRYDPRLLSDETAVMVVQQGIRLAPAWQIVKTEGTTVRAKCGQAQWPDALREESQRAAQPQNSLLCADGVAITCGEGKIAFAATDSRGGKAEGPGLAASPVYERELQTLRAHIIRALGPSFVPSDSTTTP